MEDDTFSVKSARDYIYNITLEKSFLQQKKRRLSSADFASRSKPLRRARLPNFARSRGMQRVSTQIIGVRGHPVL